MSTPDMSTGVTKAHMPVSQPTPVPLPAAAVSAATPASPPSSATSEVVIQPHRGWIGVDWKELARYRELLSFLVWRDIKVKYKQAVLGAAWSVLLPLISLGIYGGIAAAFGFGQYLTDPRPPILMWMFAGLVPWMFLQRAINDGGMSLVNNQSLMTKIYLPRLYLPLAACGNALVDMGIACGLTGLLAVYYYATQGWLPSWQIVFVPLLLVLLFVAATGLALVLSAATVLYRDLRFLIPFVVQFGLWLSAVPYPLSRYDDPTLANGQLIKSLYALNPMTGIISGFRSAITGQPWEWLHLGSSAVLCSVLLVFGLFYFKRVERRFADIA